MKELIETVRSLVSTNVPIKLIKSSGGRNTKAQKDVMGLKGLLLVFIKMCRFSVVPSIAL